MDKLTALSHCFGHTAFREGQEALIDAILSGRDALGIMPTGGGKSVCYQLPALLLGGVTVVISPLISLMRDQVLALTAAGIPAAAIHSAQTPDERAPRVRVFAPLDPHRLWRAAPAACHPDWPPEPRDPRPLVVCPRLRPQGSQTRLPLCCTRRPISHIHRPQNVFS